ncbi:MAG: CCA tRNA nucleotidyltransferase [Candidatus Nanopelagicaceae bacterium]|jgi:poly(A) polymerase
MSAISPEQAKAAANLVTLPKAAVDLARAFRAAGFRLALVGGPVRDALLGRSGNDLDFTTDARPEESMKILKGWTDATWDTGIAYGTVAGKKGDVTAEITTFRKDSYSEKSRKPEVEYGDSLEGDLRRRDFTVNAMALEIGEKENTFVDPFGGLKDIVAKKIRTPISAEELFSEDPLRMMRAARFAAQLGFEVDGEVISAIKAMKERLTIISAERIRDEFVKTLMSADPRRGLILMVESGLCEFFLPELPMLRLEIDEHHRHKDVYDHSLIVLEQAIEMEERLGGPNLTIRLAALLHDIGKPKTRALIEGGGVSFHHHEVVGSKMTKKRLKELRFDRETIDDVSTLVALHLRFHGYGSGEWTDSAVRRYVRDAGDLLVHLHVLTRADCTTRNVRKAQALAATYDQLESRIEQLAQEEELAAIRPDLNGNEIIEILGIKPGPIVGKAYDYLLELRMEHGPLGRERAIEELLKWSKQSEG